MNTLLKSINVTIVALLLSLTAVSAKATPILYFYTDFNNGLPAEFSGATTLEPVQGYAGIGTGTNFFSGDMLRNPTASPAKPTVLTLTNLPAHTSVGIEFLLAVIDSWDGAGLWGPDYLNVEVDGTVILNRNFNAKPSPAGELLTTPVSSYQLGWNQKWYDNAYNLGIDNAFENIVHSSDSLTIAWYSSGVWQGGLDESWGIDNVGVTLEIIPTPEPTTIMLLALGITGLVLWKQKTKLWES